MTVWPAGCASAGDRAARTQLERLQQGIVNEAEQQYRRGDDPVWLARWAGNEATSVEQGDGQRFEQSVEVLSWGSVDGLGGQVDLRLRVSTPGYASRSFGTSGYGPGSAIGCVRVEVGLATDSTTSIDCADRPGVAIPAAPEPLPPLDGAALRTALRSSTLPAAEAAARRSYSGLDVSSSVVDDTWVVVVVRRAPDLDCLGGTRTPSGTVRVSSPAQIRPGEGDCDPERFVRA